MSSSTTDMAIRKNVDQLRRELSLERFKVSQACADLQSFCEQNAGNDFLLTGVAPPGGNPYKEKKQCSII